MFFSGIASIDHVKFGILSEEEMKKMAVCQCTSLKLNGPNSVYDERMGVLQNNVECVTCRKTNRFCVGHFGYIALAVPIMHPLFIRNILNILRLICFRCHRFLFSKQQIAFGHVWSLPAPLRFLRIVEIAEKEDTCFHCSRKTVKVMYHTTEKCICMVTKSEEKTTVRTMIPDMDVYELFKNLPTDDVLLMGFAPGFRPVDLFLTVLPVLPPVDRPYVLSENVTCDDDLTIQYLEIIKANHHYKESQANESRRTKYLHTLKFRIRCLYDNSYGSSKHSNGRPLKGIKKRLTGKDGLIRNNLMGKRVDKSARTVIGPDPTLPIHQIAIPPEIAQILSYPVTVNEYNKKEVEGWLQSNNVNYVICKNKGVRVNAKYALWKRTMKPMYGDLIRRTGTKEFFITSERQLTCLQDGDVVIRKGVRLYCQEEEIGKKRKPFEIAIGDVVERQLKDGDVLLLNRQPTLHRGSMIAQEIRILPGKTIRMNLAICKTFNSDFDGDEMNLHCPASPETEAELRLLSMVDRHILNPQSSSFNLPIVQDSLVSAYLMTQEDEFFSREAFFDMMMAIRDGMDDSYPSLFQEYWERCPKDAGKFTGKLLFSLLLPRDFYYVGRNKGEDQVHARIVRVEKGLLLEGPITKSQLGSSHSGMLCALFHKYGSSTVLQFIDNVQFLTNHYILRRGFSVGLSDCIVTKQKEIDEIVTRNFVKAKLAEETVRDPKLREAYVMNALFSARDTGMKIAKSALNESNRFLSTVRSGSKGDYFNIAQITGLLGQQIFQGTRIPFFYNNESRSLPHYPLHAEHWTDDMRYESRGFIRNSFIHGLNPKEFFFHAMTGREGITDTAMKSVTREAPIYVWDATQAVLLYGPIGDWIDRWMELAASSSRGNVRSENDRDTLCLLSDVSYSILSTDSFGNVGWHRITSMTRHDPTTDLFTVETQSGRSVTVTSSHSLLIWNASEELWEPRSLEHVRIGDRVPVTMQSPHHPIMTSHSPLPPGTGTRSEEMKREGMFHGCFLAHAVLSLDSDPSSPMTVIHLESTFRGPVQTFLKEYCRNLGWSYHRDGTSSTLRTKFMDKRALIDCEGSTREGMEVIPWQWTEYSFCYGFYYGLFWENTKIWCLPRHWVDLIVMAAQTIGEAHRLRCEAGTKEEGGGWWIHSSCPVSSSPPHFDPSVPSQGSVFHDTIVRITRRNPHPHEKVYDFTVRPTYNFSLANGLHVRDTATSGYIQRRMVKIAEDVQVKYDGTVRNSTNSILQFHYGKLGMDPNQCLVQNQQMVPFSISQTIEELHRGLPPS